MNRLTFSMPGDGPGCRGAGKDLKQRGLLDTTLVVWGGEFGRTPMNEARGGSKFLGRDHHARAFTMWLAGGGIKPGIYDWQDGRCRATTSSKIRFQFMTCTRRCCTCLVSTTRSLRIAFRGAISG